MSITPRTAQSGQALATRSRRIPGPDGTTSRRIPGPDSAWWLVAVAAAFTITQLLFVSLRMGLSWDETVYVSQVSDHAPAAFFDAARSRGVPLLVAPVTLLTSSVAVLRVYLAVMSGAGLLAALWVWRTLRPSWVVALAGLAFGSLWVSLYYGPQAMPDEWVALSSLAGVGFFLRASAERRIGAYAGLTGCLALTALFRPGDAAFLTATLVLAVFAVPRWRTWPLLACVVVGPALGAAEWVAEAYLRFGGPLRRLHIAGAEQGGLGLHFAVWDELRALNGPTLCRPCTIGWRHPELSLWWLALPVLVTLGIAAARRAGRGESSALAAASGLGVAAQYLFGIGYAAPRFLLPAYALLAAPVADGLAGLLSGTSGQRSRIAVAGVAAALAAQAAVQLAVLNHEVAGTVTFHDDYQRIVADLGRLGVRPPCLIKGEQYIPIAYLAGCGSAGSPAAALAAGRHVVVLEHPRHHPPGYARRWRREPLAGAHILRLAGYLPVR